MPTLFQEFAPQPATHDLCGKMQFHDREGLGTSAAPMNLFRVRLRPSLWTGAALSGGEHGLGDMSTARDLIVTQLRPSPQSGSLFIMAEAWWATVIEYQRELADLTSERLAHFQEGLLEATEAADWVTGAAASHLIERAWRDYVSEMTKVLAIYTKHANAIRSRLPR